MSDWPSIFPNPTVNFGGVMNSPVARTDMASGRARQRRRFTKELRTYPVSWQFDDLQFILFQSFFRETINDGQDYFNISLPLGDSFQTYEARFVVGTDGKCWSVANDGASLNWKVSAVLEVEDAALLDDEQLELALLLYPDVELMITVSDEFHELVHQTLYVNLS